MSARVTFGPMKRAKARYGDGSAADVLLDGKIVGEIRRVEDDVNRAAAPRFRTSSYVVELYDHEGEHEFFVNWPGEPKRAHAYDDARKALAAAREHVLDILTPFRPCDPCKGAGRLARDGGAPRNPFGYGSSGSLKCPHCKGAGEVRDVPVPEKCDRCGHPKHDDVVMCEVGTLNARPTEAPCNCTGGPAATYTSGRYVATLMEREREPNRPVVRAWTVRDEEGEEVGQMYETTAYGDVSVMCTLTKMTWIGRMPPGICDSRTEHYGLHFDVGPVAAHQEALDAFARRADRVRDWRGAQTTDGERAFRVYRDASDGGALAVPSASRIGRGGLLTLDEAVSVWSSHANAWIGRMPPIDQPRAPIVRVDRHGQPIERCSGCSGPKHPDTVCPNRPNDDDERMSDLYDDRPQHEGDV